MEKLFGYISDNLVDESEQIIINNKDDINLYFYHPGWCQYITVLHYACEFGRVEIVELLLKYGADVDSMTFCTVQSLFSPLMICCTTGLFTECNLETVKLLVQHGADINIQGNYDQTALMLAIVNEKYEIVEFLIKNGANLELLDFGKRTALMEAARHSDAIYVEMLIKAGANVNFRNEYHATALIIAKRKKNNNAIQLLS